MKTNHILVVDDDKSIAEAIGDILQMEAYEVYQAYTGRDALKVAKKQNPALIILDYMLPDIDGDKVAAELKKTTTTKRYPNYSHLCIP